MKGTNLPIIQTAAEIALNHHEKYDGSGYPNGKKEKDIPLHSRMMAIIDVFDTMTHKRVYKEASSKADAIEEILVCKGSHFDPTLVDLFVKT